jgi:Luciferase-like monooxygenase
LVSNPPAVRAKSFAALIVKRYGPIDMKLSLFLEHPVPRPWEQDSEQRVFNESLEQLELADELGFHEAWLTEHHFLEEYRHSPAPEVFFGAPTQRTKNPRLGHGIDGLTRASESYDAMMINRERSAAAKVAEAAAKTQA